MSEIHERRKDAATRRRKPRPKPAPVMVELPPAPPPAPPAAEPADPRITYHVRSGIHTVEIGTSEDWWILSEALYQPDRDRLEIWAQDMQDGEMAIRLHPPDPEWREGADKILWRKFEAARPEWAPEIDDERELFAPEYHPGYTVAQARRDFWRRYNEAMGLVDFRPKPDGPVVTDEPDKYRDVT